MRVVRGRTKRCSLCKSIKRYEEFNLDRSHKKTGRQTRCRTCWNTPGECRKPGCTEWRVSNAYCQRHQDLATYRCLARKADKAFRAVTS